MFRKKKWGETYRSPGIYGRDDRGGGGDGCMERPGLEIRAALCGALVCEGGATSQNRAYSDGKVCSGPVRCIYRWRQYLIPPLQNLRSLTSDIILPAKTKAIQYVAHLIKETEIHSLSMINDTRIPDEPTRRRIRWSRKACEGRGVAARVHIQVAL